MFLLFWLRDTPSFFVGKKILLTKTKAIGSEHEKVCSCVVVGCTCINRFIHSNGEKLFNKQLIHDLFVVKVVSSLVVKNLMFTAMWTTCY